MDTTYAVSAAAWSALGFVLGFVSSSLAARRPRKADQMEAKESESDRTKRKFLAIVVVLVTLLSAAQLAWFSYEQRRATSCQADYNKAFIDALRVRTSIADSDRENLTRMVQAITNATTGEDSRRALNEYLATKARNDAERAKAPYPEDKYDSDSSC